MSPAILVVLRSFGFYLVFTIATTAILTTLLSIAGQVTTLFWSFLFLGIIDTAISILLYRKNKDLILIPSLIIFIISNGLCNFWLENIIGFCILLYYLRYLPSGYAFVLLIALGQCVSSVTLKIYGQNLSSLIPIFSIVGFLIYKLNQSKPILTNTKQFDQIIVKIFPDKNFKIWTDKLIKFDLVQITSIVFCLISLILFTVKVKT